MDRVETPLDIMAIDWSGRRTGEGASLWVAHARGGKLLGLECGLRRQEVVDRLIATSKRFDHLAVGIDFSFSFPQWFVRQHGVESAYEMWKVVERDGEAWLRACEPPFWGRPGRPRPFLAEHYRQTERLGREAGGIQPKSTFQIGGAGAVGTGSIRGMPYLIELREAGFSIWPFDPPGWPLVMEVYPRLMTGSVRKSDRGARESYLEQIGWEMGAELRELAASSEDAFDAAISALVMSEHERQILSLQPANDPREALEGSIFRPRRNQ